MGTKRDVSRQKLEVFQQYEINPKNSGTQMFPKNTPKLIT